MQQSLWGQALPAPPPPPQPPTDAFESSGKCSALRPPDLQLISPLTPVIITSTTETFKAGKTPLCLSRAVRTRGEDTWCVTLDGALPNALTVGMFDDIIVSGDIKVKIRTKYQQVAPNYQWRIPNSHADIYTNTNRTRHTVAKEVFASLSLSHTHTHIESSLYHSLPRAVCGLVIQALSPLWPLIFK